jgi:hypothetical protein
MEALVEAAPEVVVITEEDVFDLLERNAGVADITDPNVVRGLIGAEFGNAMFMCLSCGEASEPAPAAPSPVLDPNPGPIMFGIGNRPWQPPPQPQPDIYERLMSGEGRELRGLFGNLLHLEASALGADYEHAMGAARIGARLDGLTSTVPVAGSVASSCGYSRFGSYETHARNNVSLEIVASQPASTGSPPPLPRSPSQVLFTPAR